MPPRRLVGLDGAARAKHRVEVVAGTGMDHVGGYGREQYPFLELGAQGEGRVWRALIIGAGVSLRQDVADYNYALDRWRGRRSKAVVARLFVGYDGPSFHVSAGPWLYGSGRDRNRFYTTLLTFGVLRLCMGSMDSWRVLIRLGDGVSFTSEGSLALRLLVGVPPRGVHRWTAGLYTTVGENVTGLSATRSAGCCLGDRPCAWEPTWAWTWFIRADWRAPWSWAWFICHDEREA